MHFVEKIPPEIPFVMLTRSRKTQILIIMKKLSLVLFLMTGLFASCEKETNEPDPLDNGLDTTELLGTWNVVGYEVADGLSITEAEGQRITQQYTSYGKDYDMTFAFNMDPQTAVSNGSYTVVLITTLLGQEYTQEAPAYSLFESTAWEIRDGDIIFITEEKEILAKVMEQTENKIVMTMDYNESLEANGGKITTEGKLTITLER